jgi:hypothetical protein
MALLVKLLPLRGNPDRPKFWEDSATVTVVSSAPNVRAKLERRRLRVVAEEVRR